MKNNIKRVLKNLILMDKLPQGMLFSISIIVFFYTLEKNEKVLYLEYEKTIPLEVNSLQLLKESLITQKIPFNFLETCNHFRFGESDNKKKLYVHYFNLRNFSFYNHLLDSVEFQISSESVTDLSGFILDGGSVFEPGDFIPEISRPELGDCNYFYFIKVKNLSNRASIPLRVITFSNNIPFPIKINENKSEFNFTIPSNFRKVLFFIFSKSDIIITIAIIIFVLYLLMYGYLKDN